MAKFDDLPDELVTRIVALLGIASRPYCRRKDLPALICLGRTSRRFCELTRPEIYRAVDLGDGYSVYRFFRKSGIAKVPVGTLRKMFIGPSGEDSFAGLVMDFEEYAVVYAVNSRGLVFGDDDDGDEGEFLRKVKEEETNGGNSEDGDEARFVAALAKHCTEVLYLEIYLCCQSGAIEDNHPDYYLPIFKALNPKSIIYDSGFSPVAMEMADQDSPSINFSELLDAFSSYTRLTYLRMPFVNFDKITQAHLDILSRLPIEYLRLDWPSSLTSAKIFSILRKLTKLRENGLVISCHSTMTEVEFGGGRATEEDFAEKNAGLTLSMIRAYFEAKKQERLMEKLLWLVPSGEDDSEEGDTEEEGDSEGNGTEEIDPEGDDIDKTESAGTDEDDEANEDSEDDEDDEEESVRPYPHDEICARVRKEQLEA